MLPKSPILRRKRLQNSRKQKITVVEIVSTTVTDLSECYKKDTFIHSRNKMSSFELKKSKSKETKLSNPVIHDFIALLFLFDKVCTSIETKKHTYETLHDLFHQKFTRNKSFFETNEVLISSYEFVVKIVDFLYNSAYTI